MKPVRTLIFFLTVFAALALLALVFPDDGISLGKDAQLKFADLYSLFEKDSSGVSEVTVSLLETADLFDDPEAGDIDTVMLMRDTLPDLNRDSILRARVDSISKNIRQIEFPEGKEDILQPFFQRARSAQDAGKVVRIMHYGDSQLEVDRMTCLIRYRLQKVFGGSGCGLVSAVPLYFGHPTYTQSNTGDWKRYTGFGERDSTLTHRKYGAMNSFCSVPADSSGKEVSLVYEFRKGRRASRFSRMKIYLHSDADSGMIRVTVNDSIIDTLSNIRQGLQTLNYEPATLVSKLQMDFTMPEGGRIYGIAFDPASGLQVDNIAMRGSSGLEFRRQDSSCLSNMMQELDPALFILQFGGNTVPYIKATAYYERSFKKELAYIHELCPDAAIIVVGPSDMSRKEKGKFVTWESVEPVRDALRTAALESGCAFWDMYEAMGGMNSMEAFVKADPPLAQTDYIHFTPRGANLIAGMFCSALMVEYNDAVNTERLKVSDNSAVQSDALTLR